MSKTAVCNMCGLEFDPEDGLVHDNDGNGTPMCYDCTMKLRNAVPEELGGAPAETPLDEYPASVNYFTVAEAKMVLNVLDPIRGAVGKDAELTVRTAPDGLSMVMTDQGASSEIEVQVRFDDEHIIDHGTTEAIVCVGLDKLMTVIKTFGSEAVTIAAEGSEVIVQSKMATWRLPQIRTNGNRPKLHAFSVNGESADVTLQAMKRILYADYMGEVFAVSMEDRMLKMTAEDESGREMLTVRAQQDSSVDFPVRSQFGYDVVGDVVSKIHADADKPIDLEMQDKGPMELRWAQGAASIRAVFAPRL